MDEEITGDNNYRGTYTIDVGPSFTIASTGCASFSAGDTIQFQNGFQVDPGGRFKAVNE